MAIFKLHFAHHSWFSGPAYDHP